MQEGIHRMGGVCGQYWRERGLEQMLSGKLLTLLSMSRNFKMMKQSISVGQLLFEQSAAHWAEVDDIRID